MIIEMKQNEIELMIDFVRYLEWERPDRDELLTSEEIYNFFAPYVAEYFSPQNLIDDTYCFFNKIMELN